MELEPCQTCPYRRVTELGEVRNNGAVENFDSLTALRETMAPLDLRNFGPIEHEIYTRPITIGGSLCEPPL